MQRTLVAMVLVVLSLGHGGALLAADNGAPAKGPSVIAEVPLAGCGDTGAIATTLAASFPARLRGEALDVVACDGPAWLATHDISDPDSAIIVERAEALVEAVGRSMADLAIATTTQQSGSRAAATITGIRVEGAQASRLVEPAIRLMFGIERPNAATLVYGDREVFTFRGAKARGVPPTVAFATFGDTLWLVTARRELGTRIVASLPAPGGRVEVPELGVAVTLPEHWTGQIGPWPEFPPEGAGVGTRGWEVLRALSPPKRGRGHGGAAGSCQLFVYRPTALTPRDFAAAMLMGDDASTQEFLEFDDGLIGLLGPAQMFGTGIDVGLYLAGSDDAVVKLLCLSRKAPDERWQAIAESIDFIPVVGLVEVEGGIVLPDTLDEAIETARPSFSTSKVR